MGSERESGSDGVPQQLRDAALKYGDPLYHQAADLIEAQQARIEQLEAELDTAYGKVEQTQQHWDDSDTDRVAMSDDGVPTPDPRADCCADDRKPCTYHEGWLDALDSAAAGRDLARRPHGDGVPPQMRTQCAFCGQLAYATHTMRRKGTTDPAFNVEFCGACYGRWHQQKELAEFELSSFVGTDTFGGPR